MKEKIESATQFIKESRIGTIDLGIILGTGLGKLFELIEDPIIIPYSKIPNFPISTVEFHAGELYYGSLFGKNVLAFKGRFHLYEGYDYFQITFPIRLLNALHAKKVILSNAAGGINLDFQKGDLMLIKDHIHLQGGSPLAIKKIEELGERFVDMCNPYSKSLRKKSLSVAEKLMINVQQGVYVSLVGPQLETAAEYRFLKIIGGDAVGMSTTAEVIVARQLKMQVLAFTIITDLCDPNNLKPIDLKDIFASASIGEEKLIDIMKELIPII